MTIDPEYHVACANCGHIKGRHSIMHGCQVIWPGKNERCICVGWARPVPLPPIREGMDVLALVSQRDVFLTQLCGQLGIELDVSINGTMDAIMAALVTLQRDRARLLQELESALKITTADDIPDSSRIRIVLGMINDLMRIAQRKSFEGWQERSFDWFLTEIERAIGAEGKIDEDNPARMDRVLRLLRELVDAP